MAYGRRAPDLGERRPDNPPRSTLVALPELKHLDRGFDSPAPPLPVRPPPVVPTAVGRTGECVPSPPAWRSRVSTGSTCARRPSSSPRCGGTAPARPTWPGCSGASRSSRSTNRSAQGRCAARPVRHGRADRRDHRARRRTGRQGPDQRSRRHPAARRRGKQDDRGDRLLIRRATPFHAAPGSSSSGVLWPAGTRPGSRPARRPCARAVTSSVPTPPAAASTSTVSPSRGRARRMSESAVRPSASSATVSRSARPSGASTSRCATPAPHTARASGLLVTPVSHPRRIVLAGPEPVRRCAIAVRI